ncbi:MAG: SCP2 sterol-binding domain-containing protein, partial [Corallincola sp.]|nr:SCP2 sterol-binding domain-containing protein [Corallincola sp.]
MVAALLQSLINGALKRAGGSAPLARFSGKRLLLGLLPLNLNLLLQADGQGVSLSRVAADTTTADCQLWLDHGALPLLHDPQQLGPLLAAGHVRLQGDAELAAELLRSLRQQGVNGEELLAGVVGDPLAHLLWRTGRQLQQR